MTHHVLEEGRHPAPLACDAVCELEGRKAQLADAFGADPAAGAGSSSFDRKREPCYSGALLAAAKGQPKFVEGLERALASFLADKTAKRCGGGGGPRRQSQRSVAQTRWSDRGCAARGVIDKWLTAALPLMPSPSSLRPSSLPSLPSCRQLLPAMRREQRALAHDLAAQYGLATASAGADPSRAVELFKTPTAGAPSRLLSRVAATVGAEQVAALLREAEGHPLRCVDIAMSCDLHYYLRQWDGGFALEWESGEVAVARFRRAEDLAGERGRWGRAGSAGGRERERGCARARRALRWESPLQLGRTARAQAQQRTSDQFPDGPLLCSPCAQRRWRRWAGASEACSGWTAPGSRAPRCRSKAPSPPRQRRPLRRAPRARGAGLGRRQRPSRGLASSRRRALRATATARCQVAGP